MVESRIIWLTRQGIGCVSPEKNGKKQILLLLTSDPYCHLVDLSMLYMRPLVLGEG